jgi:SAM-dependent methyltransferase
LTDVYATARRGWRTRLADPLAARARRRRHAQLFALTGITEESRIVDLGCGPLGLRAFAPELDITGVDRADRPGYPGPFVQADVTARLPFADGEFDLAFSNSVIEHVGDRGAFAAELMRVARGWWVQTPAFSFPVEPHALLPGAHWLPPALRRRYWRLGVAGEYEEIALLRRGELERLLPGGRIVAERVGPLAKSWISCRSPGGPTCTARPPRPEAPRSAPR